MKGEREQAQDVDRFFSRFSKSWDSLYGRKRNAFWRWFDGTFRKDIYERYELSFAALGEDLTAKTILDVGCGNGVYAFEAVRRGASLVTGIDISEQMISLCEKRSRELGLSDRARFICSVFPPASRGLDLRQHDLGIVMGVMDYVADPGPFLVALRGLLREFAVISFPGKRWLRWQLRRCRYKLLGRCAVFHYDEAKVRETCIQAGFEKLDVNYLSHSGGCYFVKAYV